MTSVLPRCAFPALGTTAVVLTTDHRDLDAAVAAVTATVHAVDLACSRFRDDSDLSRLNAAGGAALEVSPVLLDALAVAVRAARLTDGLVDPSVGSAVRILGYDRDFAHVAPTGPAIQVRVGPVPGWRAIAIDRAAGSARIPASVTLDLGATAKAWCADQAAAAAAATCRSGVLVSLGGDIAAQADEHP